MLFKSILYFYNFLCNGTHNEFCIQQQYIVNCNFFYINGENVIKMIFFFKIYYNRLTNLNISNNIKIKMYTLIHGTHVTCYNKFKILAFFFFFFFFPKLQSQAYKVYTIHILMISFKP